MTAGRDTFTSDEIAEIRSLLEQIRQADREEQKRLRARLRGEFRVFITDYLTDQTGMLPSDLDDLVRRGAIRVQDVAPPAAVRVADPVPWTPEPAELVASSLPGSGRDACVRLCAAAIRAAERIDSTRTAVTPIKTGPRFRVIGGVYQGIAPWQGLLGVAVPASNMVAVR